ncbi:MAG: diguanylate cyclase [Candidatus Omnitrophota bacterium]
MDRISHGIILVIDPDQKVRDKFKELFSEKGYTVYTADTGMDAAKKIKGIPADMVITEIKIPDLNGIEVIRKFKQINSDLCIIVLTAHESVETAVAAMKDGALDYIKKPFKLDELSHIVNRTRDYIKLSLGEKRREVSIELGIADELTKVYNRRYFDEVINREINRVKRYNRLLSLIMISVEDLQAYNEAYGSSAADKILVEIGKTLNNSCRNVDYVCRYASDEFSVILPETGKYGASATASRMLNLSRLIRIDDPKAILSGRASLCIGVVSCPDDAVSKEQLILRASSVLAQAKKMGKNKVSMFGTGDDAVKAE